MVYFKIIIALSFLMVGGYFAGTSDDADIELSVSEGGNLTVFTTIARSEEDPQVLLSLLNGTSNTVVAQLICHNQICENQCSDLLIEYDKHNVSVVLVNARSNQTGLYKMYVHIGTHSEDRIYNITVIKPALIMTISSDSSSSSMISKHRTAGIGAAVGLGILVFIIAVIKIHDRHCRKHPDTKQAHALDVHHSQPQFGINMVVD